MKVNIGITEENRKAVAGQLAKLLADEFILYTKTLNAHWNVEGKDFHSMHVFFEEQYGQLQDLVDRVAERIRSLGHYAPASLKEFLSLTHLSERNFKGNSGTDFVAELLQDHESIIEFIRGNIIPFAEDFKDAGSSDLVTAIIEEHEKLAWMLRVHL